MGSKWTPHHRTWIDRKQTRKIVHFVWSDSNSQYQTKPTISVLVDFLFVREEKIGLCIFFGLFATQQNILKCTGNGKRINATLKGNWIFDSDHDYIINLSCDFCIVNIMSGWPLADSKRGKMILKVFYMLEIFYIMVNM